jgi:hypothetical protein
VTDLTVDSYLRTLRFSEADPIRAALVAMSGPAVTQRDKAIVLHQLLQRGIELGEERMSEGGAVSAATRDAGSGAAPRLTALDELDGLPAWKRALMEERQR